MKNLVLIALFVGSTVAMAKASDQYSWCHVVGQKNGKTVELEGPKVKASKWIKAREKALALCKSKGLSNCKIDWCRTDSHR